MSYCRRAEADSGSRSRRRTTSTCALISDLEELAILSVWESPKLFEGGCCSMKTEPMTRRVFAVLFCLAFFQPAVRGQERFEGVSRIVAVGDVHGGFSEFVSVLRSAGVLDEKNSWIAAKTHLVQTGDVVDRGPDSRQV